MRSVAVRARQATRARACECEDRRSPRRDPGETKPKRGVARENPRQSVCPYEKFHPWKNTLCRFAAR